MHDGTGETAIDYEMEGRDLAWEQAMDDWEDFHWTHRVHTFKIRREGFRELLLSKDWGMRGAYASKTIAGRECIISGAGGDHPDYLIGKICLKHPVEKVTQRSDTDPIIRWLEGEVTREQYLKAIRFDRMPEKWWSRRGMSGKAES